MGNEILGAILTSVENTLGVKIVKEKRSRGNNGVADAKKIYFHISREYTNLSLHDIGVFIKKTHCTVHHGYKACENLLKMKHERIFKNKYENCLSTVEKELKKVKTKREILLVNFKESQVDEFKKNIKTTLSEIKELNEKINLCIPQLNENTTRAERG